MIVNPLHKAEFDIGDHVRKTSGYRFEGTVQAAFTTRSGYWRYVVEHFPPQTGLLHIFSGKDLEKDGVEDT